MEPVPGELEYCKIWLLPRMVFLPTIRTERLIMRPLSLADTPALHLLWTNSDVAKFLYDGQQITLEEAEETVRENLQLAEDKGLGIWCLSTIDAETELIGFYGVRHIGETPEIELVWGLLPTYWKRGLATEASKAALAYLFATQNVECIFAGTDPANVSSFEVMKRLGMMPVQDGTVPVPGAVYYCMDRSRFSKTYSDH